MAHTKSNEKTKITHMEDLTEETPDKDKLPNYREAEVLLYSYILELQTHKAVKKYRELGPLHPGTIGTGVT